MIVAVVVPAEASGSLSGAADIRDLDVIGVQYPATWVNAKLSFQVSDDGATYKDLYDDNGTEAQVAGAANADRFIGFRGDLAFILGRWNFIKVRSGLTGAHVDQTTDRTINLIVKSRVAR